jgi:hypothetical protein
VRVITHPDCGQEEVTWSVVEVEVCPFATAGTAKDMKNKAETTEKPRITRRRRRMAGLQGMGTCAEENVRERSRRGG